MWHWSTKVMPGRDQEFLAGIKEARADYLNATTATQERHAQMTLAQQEYFERLATAQRESWSQQVETLAQSINTLAALIGPRPPGGGR
jgi:hypothetical protein